MWNNQKQQKNCMISDWANDYRLEIHIRAIMFGLAETVPGLYLERFNVSRICMNAGPRFGLTVTNDAKPPAETVLQEFNHAVLILIL